MQIVKVETKKQLKQFIEFGIDLYKNCEYSCPPLYSDEVETLSREKNPAFEVCDAAYFMAIDESGKVIGRIAGIINYRANSHWNVKKVRFGWFDFIDDLSVSKALLDAVVVWGKEKGMTALNGPVGFTDLDKEGLLVDGFQDMQLMACSYNYEYYIKHYDAYGLTVDNTWHESKLKNPDEIPERLARVADIVRERSNVKLYEVKSTKDLLKKFGYSFFDLIDECYSGLYNYSPLTQRQKYYYSHIYFPILNYDFVTIVVNEKEELVAVGVTMPNLTQVLRKIKGKLFPFGWYRLLKTMRSKHHDEVDLLLIAVRSDYQGKGVNSLLFAHQMPNYKKYGVKYANVTNVLEDNGKCNANWVYFEKVVDKTRHAYIKSI